MLSQDITNPHKNLNRCIIQLQERVIDYCRFVLSYQNTDEQKQILKQKKNEFEQRILDFQKYHFRVYEELYHRTQIRQLITLNQTMVGEKLLRDLETQVHLPKEESLVTFNENIQRKGIDMVLLEQKDNRDLKEKQVVIWLLRPKDEQEKNCWYMALFIFPHPISWGQCFQVLDFQINPLDSTKPLSDVTQVPVDSDLILFKKLNIWFRSLYFSRYNVIEDGFHIFDYIKETMNKLFSTSDDTTCVQCKKFFKLGINPGDGPLPPYMLHNPDLDEQRGSQSRYGMFHEQCLFP